MKISRKQTFQTLAIARHRADQRLAKLPNVWATAYGVKRIDGELTQVPCYTVYVSKKIPSKKIDKNDLVPKSLKRNGKSLLTDVIELGPLRLHGIVDPSKKGRIITGGKLYGTLGCFAKGNGEILCLSCAHVTGGQDEDPNTPEQISLWDPSRKEWHPIGISTVGLYERGNGYPPDFGKLDAGLVRIQDVTVRRFANSLPPLQVFMPKANANVPALLQGTPLRAKGAMSGICEGVVTGVWMRDIRGSGISADLVITDQQGADLTRPGDSGMLWKDRNGTAVAIHILGEDRGPEPSRVSLSAFVYRITNHFHIDLLEGA